jgi:hypothetical protein
MAEINPDNYSFYDQVHGLPKNLHAIRLYEKGGYIPEKFCPDFFGVGEEWLIMKYVFGGTFG